jgi:hypothetical protein
MDPQRPGAGWAGGQGHLRASDADREHAVDVLKTAFAEGRLSKAELLGRAGQALTSKTYAELGSATGGIPAWRAPAAARQLAPSRQAVPPDRARQAAWKVIAWVVSAVIVVPGLGLAFFATQYGSFFIMLLFGSAAAAWTGSPGPENGRRQVL